jgi:hypothetical protein
MLKFCHYIVMTIKNFNDLVFNSHANHPNGVQAKLDLGNNTEISVVSNIGEGSGLYGNVSEGTYEVAVFHNDNMIPLATYDDVIGHQTEEQLTELMANLQGDFQAQFIANLYIGRDEKNNELGLTNHA